MLLDSGHEATLLEEEELAQQLNDFTGYKDGMVRLNPGRWLYPAGFTKYANRIFNFKWRTSDVVVMTYPKCGTTWTQEIVWTMRNNANFDHPLAMDSITDRSPFIELDGLIPEKAPADILKMVCPSSQRLCPNADPKDGISFQVTEATPDPRTIKTHLPFTLLHSSLLDTTKVVYVVRNPKDVLVSYLHHSRLFPIYGFVGNMDVFAKHFINGDLIFGSYDTHVREAWERRGHPNLHIVFYEDLKADTLKELHRLNDFLGTQLTDEQLKKIGEYTSFDQMKARGNSGLMHLYDKEIQQKDGGFFRKGQSGDWKKTLSEDVTAEMDAWIKEQFDFGITFK